MLGAIAGDIIGSPYEHDPIKTTKFPLFRPSSRFTDDSVLTSAIASKLLFGGDYTDALERFYYHYPLLPYGAKFLEWASSINHQPYGSWGNGSAMRVSPVPYFCSSVEEVLKESKRSAEPTHDHPEGIRGAQAVALSIYLALEKESKVNIRDAVARQFGFDLKKRVDAIRPSYSCDFSCQNTVPQAIVCFIESDDFESAIRLAVSLGGDSDTMACITGSIAEAFYGGVPQYIRKPVLERLDNRLRAILEEFEEAIDVTGRV